MECSAIRELAVGDVGLERGNSEDNTGIVDLGARARGRSGSELALQLRDAPALLADADGMSGHAAGEVASEQAIRQYLDCLSY